MSKINNDFLKKAINEMLTERKKRKFTESVELQVGLRDYDPEKRFAGTIKLPHKVYSGLKVNHRICEGLCFGKCCAH
jgi:large subunit ribosomal protein L10Ae